MSRRPITKYPFLKHFSGEKQPPLNEAELDWLAQTMGNIQANMEEGMSLSMADGFFTALAIGPVDVPPDEWLSWVLAEELDLAHEQEVQRLLSLLMRHYHRVRYVMRQAQPLAFEPVFLYQLESEQPWVADWCHGFVAGVNICHDAWQAVMPQSVEVTTLELIVGMSTLLPPDIDPNLYVEANDETDPAALMIAQQMRAKAQEALELYRQQFDPNAQWETLLEVCVMQLRDQLQHPKTGEVNCPCGSGRAFTECCGNSDRKLH
jgi:uncharacterized protein